MNGAALGMNKFGETGAFGAVAGGIITLPGTHFTCIPAGAGVGVGAWRGAGVGAGTGGAGTFGWLHGVFDEL